MGDLSSHKLSIDVLAVSSGTWTGLGTKALKSLGVAMVPLFDGAAQCKVSQCVPCTRLLKHHGYLLSTLDAIVLEIKH